MKKGNDSEDRQLVRIEDIGLEEAQLAEQLYNSAGLDPVVEAGLKDYGKRLQQEDKLISKVIGPRGSDIKGYGEAVAKRVALAVYALLNRQYGGKVGDLRSYIMALEDERDRANTRYDDLMGRVVGILGDEYRELRTDSNAFMEKLTTILGEDLKESKVNHKALAESLADIDALRSQIRTLDTEKKEQKKEYEAETAALRKQGDRQKEGYESQLAQLRSEHGKEIGSLRSQTADMDTRIKELESEKTALQGALAQLRAQLKRVETTTAALAEAIPREEMGKRMGEELYAFILKDSKVPDMVLDGVGKFIDFRKYLGLATVRGAEEGTAHAEKALRKALSE